MRQTIKLRVLNHLLTMGLGTGITANEIATETGIKLSSVSSALKRLVKEGVVAATYACGPRGGCEYFIRSSLTVSQFYDRGYIIKVVW